MPETQFVSSKIIGVKNNRNIIILHGLYGSCDSLLFLGKKLADNYSVHLLNLRNHANSIFSDSMTYDIMVEDIKNYLSQHNILTASFIGHSMGGKIAMFFAKKYPQLCENIVAIDISPISYLNLTSYNEISIFHLNLLSKLKQMELEKFHSYSELKRKLIEDNLDINIVNLVLKNIEIKSDEDNKMKLNWKINLLAIENNIGNIMTGLEIEDFQEKKILTKSLFFKAANSDYIQPEDKKIIKYIFPNSEIIEIENSSHWVNVDNPNKLCDEVLFYFGMKN